MRENEENSRQILLCIATYFRLYGFPPSFLELFRMCSLKSTAAVRQCLRQLEEENWITYDASKAECIVLKTERTRMFEQRPVLTECG